MFRGQDITPKQQRRFVEHFGPLRDRAIPKNEDGYIFISNREDGGAVGDGELAFHSDHSFVERPDTAAILLYALAVPSHGGETLYANMQHAYEDLPDDMKARIANLHALHVLGTLGIPRGTRAKLEEIETRWRAVQPLAWRLPDTGKQVLFVSEYVNHVVELGQAEGDELLARLEAHLYRGEFIYKHRWRPGDVIVWNNRTLQHARAAFDPSEARTLRKSTVGDSLTAPIR